MTAFCAVNSAAAPRPGAESTATAAAPPAAAPPAAAAEQAAPQLPLAMLLPAVGTSPEQERVAFDTALRAGLEGLHTHRLQPAEETRKHILSLAELGLICVPDDTPCLVKLGLAAEADLVLVPVVDADTGAPGTSNATLIAVAVDKGTVGATANGRGTFNTGAALTALLEAALGIAPTQHPPPAAAAPAPSPGVLLTGAGAAVTGLALVSALAAELAYAHLLPVDANTRADVARPIGIAAWVVTVIGGAALITGVVLLGTAPPPPPALDGAAVEAP